MYKYFRTNSTYTDCPPDRVYLYPVDIHTNADRTKQDWPQCEKRSILILRVSTLRTLLDSVTV